MPITHLLVRTGLLTCVLFVASLLIILGHFPLTFESPLFWSTCLISLSTVALFALLQKHFRARRDHVNSRAPRGSDVPRTAGAGPG